ncbi:MAG: hypothetical protein IPH12_15870 [Saprospirales bacterium]|nr:hypothetical protein [Saprospirales bacterium]
MRTKYSGLSGSAGWEMAAATVFLLAAAFHNGYPLVFSDTGTYVSSGFEGKIPVDRPIAYGLFIRHMSMAVTLWGPVLVQGFLTAWLLRTLLLPLAGDRFAGKFLFLVAALCMLTGLPWYAGQLMPDIFTAMQVLILGIVLTRPRIARRLWVALGALFVCCCLVHFSNLFIGLLTVVGVAAGLLVWPAGRPFFPRWRFRMAVVGAWCALAFLALPALNWAVERQFTLGNGSYTFIIGRMVDSGMLKMYLDDACPTNAYRLCQYKDSLPENSRQFHWDGNSPLHKEGAGARRRPNTGQLCGAR